MTEWTSTNQNGTIDGTSINEGMGGYVFGCGARGNPGMVNTRQAYIQGIDNSANSNNAVFLADNGSGTIPNNYLPAGVSATGATYCTRRYQINFAFGLFTQDKLVSFIFDKIDPCQIHGITIGY